MDIEINLLLSHQWSEMADHRSLLTLPVGITEVPKWKIALWETNAIEPAMLRAPFIIIIFIFLWGLNVAIFERNRLQYYMTLNIKNGMIL